jgi:hypothetical protein
MPRAAGQADEVADVECEDAASLRGSTEQLRHIGGIERYPVGWCACNFVAARPERSLQWAAGCVGVEV